MMITIPSMTILMADFAADCFNVTPRNAPIIARREMPIKMDVEVEYTWEIMTSGNSKARDASVDVVDVTSPERRALRWTIDRSS